jgi:hypothetical protein
VRAHELIPLLLTAVPVALLLTLLLRDRSGHLERELRSVPRRPAGQLAEGMFRIVGSGRRGEDLLTAPVTGRPCLAWRLVVERAQGSLWTTAADLSACAEFWVEDPTGRAAVSPAGQFVLAVDSLDTATRGQWDSVPAEIAGRLDRLRASPQVRTAVWLPGETGELRFTEARLQEGQNLCVGGEVHREPHPLGEVSPARTVPMRWLFRGTPDNPLIVIGGPG